MIDEVLAWRPYPDLPPLNNVWWRRCPKFTLALHSEPRPGHQQVSRVRALDQHWCCEYCGTRKADAYSVNMLNNLTDDDGPDELWLGALKVDGFPLLAHQVSQLPPPVGRQPHPGKVLTSRLRQTIKPAARRVRKRASRVGRPVVWHSVGTADGRLVYLADADLSVAGERWAWLPRHHPRFAELVGTITRELIAYRTLVVWSKSNNCDWREGLDPFVTSTVPRASLGQWPDWGLFAESMEELIDRPVSVMSDSLLVEGMDRDEFQEVAERLRHYVWPEYDRYEGVDEEERVRLAYAEAVATIRGLDEWDEGVARLADYRE